MARYNIANSNFQDNNKSGYEVVMIAGSNGAVTPFGGTVNLNYVVNLFPTVSTTAYAGNNVIGGLITAPVLLSNTQPTGQLTQFEISIANGSCTGLSTLGITVYLFSKSPAGTYTNKTNVNVTNNDFFYILTQPFVMSFPATSIPQGTTQAMTIKTFTPPIPLQNLDTVTSNNIYIALVANGAVTFTGASDLSISLSGERDV